MKAKVIKLFKDKRTKVIYNPGQDIEVTRERFEELTSAALGPFVEQLKDSEQKKVETPKNQKKRQAKSR